MHWIVVPLVHRVKALVSERGRILVEVLVEVSLMTGSSAMIQEREIRDALLLLSNLVNKITHEQLLFNHFYNAAVDKKENQCIPAFWNVLHKLVCPEIPPCVGNVYCVKTEFVLLGYQSLNFYGLPIDHTHGSYELLLALSWLVANGTLDSLVEERLSISPVTEEFDIAEEEKVNCERPGLIGENAVNHLIVIANLLKLKSYKIEDLVHKCDSLIDKVHKCTSNIRGIKTLTVNECSIFTRDNDHLAGYMAQLFELNDVSEAHILWLKKKDVYMKWIVAVHEKSQEDAVKFYQHDSCSSTLRDFFSSLPGFLERRSSRRARNYSQNRLYITIRDLTIKVQKYCDLSLADDNFSALIDELCKLNELMVIEISP